MDAAKTVRSARKALDFGPLVIRITQFLHTRGSVAIALSEQVLNAGTGSSPRDTLAKQKISLRELKECRFRLRLVRAAGFLMAEHDPVIEENRESEVRVEEL